MHQGAWSMLTENVQHAASSVTTLVSPEAKDQTRVGGDDESYPIQPFQVQLLKQQSSAGVRFQSSDYAQEPPRPSQSKQGRRKSYTDIACPGKEWRTGQAQGVGSWPSAQTGGSLQHARSKVLGYT